MSSFPIDSLASRVYCISPWSFIHEALNAGDATAVVPIKGCFYDLKNPSSPQLSCLFNGEINSPCSVVRLVLRCQAHLSVAISHLSARFHQIVLNF